jgi:hypothetical protein
MPFIVQCPHAECRKYMLLEDEVRGTTVICLLCSRAIRVDASGSDSHHGQPGSEKPAPPAAAPPAAAPPPAAAAPPKPSAPAAALQSDQKVIVNCPNPQCRSPLKVAPSAKGTKLRCPKCKGVFTA